MKINEEKVKFGKYEVEWKGTQLMFKVNGKLVKAVDVDPNSFGINDFKKTVKKLAAMKKLEDELPFSILAAGVQKEAVDHIDDEEADTDYKDLEDKDIDNDGDEDESDKYLHHKLGTTAKKTENIKLKSILQKEAAPKMKMSPYVKKLGEFIKSFDKLENNFKREDGAAYSHTKGKFKKVFKSLSDLSFDVRKYGKNY